MNNTFDAKKQTDTTKDVASQSEGTKGKSFPAVPVFQKQNAEQTQDAETEHSKIPTKEENENIQEPKQLKPFQFKSTYSDFSAQAKINNTQNVSRFSLNMQPAVQMKKETDEELALPDKYIIPEKTYAPPLQKMPAFTSTQMPIQRMAIFPAIDQAKFQSEFHNTSFLTRINVVPIQNDGSGNYKAAQIWVREVKISDDRPPTKYGSGGQRSHTVAWTLLRAALQKLNNQPLDKFIEIIFDMAKTSDLPTASVNANKAATALYAGLNAGIGTMRTTDRLVTIVDWQQEASDLLTNFIHYYQLSEAATYADGQAVGHGESSNMEILGQLETKAKFGDLLPDEIGKAVTAAAGMFDAKNSLSPKILAQILHHWLYNLHLAFPTLLRKYHDQTVAGFIAKLGINDLGKQAMTHAFGSDPSKVSDNVKTKDIAASVNSHESFNHALPKANQSTFVANVMLKGAAGAKKDLPLEKQINGAKDNALISVDHFSYDQILIEQLKVADDRPDTRFGTLQRSHTVAWTLVRRHLMSFGGQSLTALINFIAHELGVLKNDIDAPKDNSKIKFEAAQSAGVLQVRLNAIVANKEQEPIHQWQAAISELVETYVTLYQLSRSATYSKEERPKGHGEAQATKGLGEANDFLLKTTDPDKRREYMDENVYDLAELAVKLVDAVVANGNLQPGNWQIAIQHWLTLIKHYYPELVKYKDFMEKLEELISVAEPEGNTLVGYAPANNKEKLLVNLYESAKNEIKSFPRVFEKDLKTSMRLELNNSAYVPPNYDEWDSTIDKLAIPKSYKYKWDAILVEYFRNSKRGAPAKPIPTSKHVEGGPGSIQKLAIDVEGYLTKVKSDEEKLSDDLVASFIKKAAGTPNEAYATAMATNIKNSIKKGMANAIELSALTEIDNYKKWFNVIASIETGADINYETVLKAIEEESKKKD
ncbi:hypothetical protein ACI6Q2_17435 [Chitinophagaceae bacterium LWZ2-11]